jgi:hypothetical protein
MTGQAGKTKFRGRRPLQENCTDETIGHGTRILAAMKMRCLRTWFKLIAAVAVMVAVLVFLANFSLRQSVVLAVVIVLLGHDVMNMSPKPNFRFSPYWTYVVPNWRAILCDYKLYRDEDEWREVQSVMSALAEANKTTVDYNFGFYYTTIRAESPEHPMLVYRDNSFRSSVDYWSYLKPFSRNPWPDSLEPLGALALFMKLGSNGGFDLGIQVPSNWWEKLKPLCPTPLAERFDYACGCVNLTIAVLPYAEFGMYWDPIEYDNGAHADSVWAQIAETRRQHNWAEAAKEEDFHFTRHRIMHRYFSVEHRPI